MRLLLPLLLWACSAPPMDEAPDRGPAPSPAELEAERAERAGAATPRVASAPAQAPPAGRPAAPPSAPSPPADRSPTPVQPTRDDLLPALPYTAWTTAPLTLTPDGGSPARSLDRIGVRVEVLEAGDRGLRVRCAGCQGEDAGLEGWIPGGRVRAARAPGGSGDALDVMLTLRAGWAGGRRLPEGATNVQLCALVDAGFELDADLAAWELAGGTAKLAWDGQRWTLGDLVPPTQPPPATCRADGPRPSGGSPKEGP